ncbi:MAG: NERD domain-containing protein [Gaiellaceae bacterium MAG52_C11]|nr:NERD domain-containing protein [Candidatus Gaiellasilicea maunaloa]
MSRLIRLRWWELVVGGVLLLVALLWLVGGLIVPGVVLLLLMLFAAASRAQVVERNVAGAHARTRAFLSAIRALVLLSIYVVTVVLLWVVQRRDWTEDTPGLIAAFACAGLAVYLLRDVSRYGNEAVDYFAGGRGELRVAEELEPLREQGWTIIHNVPREGRGNLDHFVSGSTGAYAIETKIGKYRASDRGQAVSNAIWAKDRFGQRFVTAVLCVFNNPPREPRMERHGNSEIWVLGPSQLRGWLLAHRWVPRSTR